MQLWPDQCSFQGLTLSNHLLAATLTWWRQCRLRQNARSPDRQARILAGGKMDSIQCLPHVETRCSVTTGLEDAVTCRCAGRNSCSLSLCPRFRHLLRVYIGTPDCTSAVAAILSVKLPDLGARNGPFRQLCSHGVPAPSSQQPSPGRGNVVRRVSCAFSKRTRGDLPPRIPYSYSIVYPLWCTRRCTAAAALRRCTAAKRSLLQDSAGLVTHDGVFSQYDSWAVPVGFSAVLSTVASHGTVPGPCKRPSVISS